MSTSIKTITKVFILKDFEVLKSIPFKSLSDRHKEVLDKIQKN